MVWSDKWEGKTIGAALDEATEKYGDRVAFVFENGLVTFNQLKQTSDIIARGFLGLGVGKGDKAAIWMAGYAEWAFVYFALARIGAIMVPVNTRYRPEEVEYLLNKSKAPILVLKEEPNKNYIGLLKELCPGVGAASGSSLNEQLPYLKKIIVASGPRLNGCLSFEDLAKLGASIPEGSLKQAAGKIGSEDIAMIQFTSGTTAMPKGAMLFQAAMLRGACCGSQALELTAEDRFFSPQPFFHVGGSIQVMLAPIVSGCTMIVQPYFDAGAALELMERHRCNVLMGHQPHYIEYLNHPELKQRRLILEKGMIFASPEVNRRVYDEMGIKKLISPYGLTETHIGGTACDDGRSPGIENVNGGAADAGRRNRHSADGGPGIFAGGRARGSLFQRMVHYQRLFRRPGENRRGIGRRGLVSHRRFGRYRRRWLLTPDRPHQGHDPRRRRKRRRGGRRVRAFKARGRETGGRSGDGRRQVGGGRGGLRGIETGKPKQ